MKARALISAGALALLSSMIARPALASCYTVPDYRTGLDRVLCQPDAYPAAPSLSLPPSNLLDAIAGQGPNQNQYPDWNAINANRESALRQQILQEQLRQLQNQR